MRLLIPFHILLHAGCARQDASFDQEVLLEKAPPVVKTQQSKGEVNFPCTMKVRQEGDKLHVVTTITNRTDSEVMFVDHPNHRGASIYAADRSKDEGYDLMFVSYPNPSPSYTIRVMPGASASFRDTFSLRWPEPGLLDVSVGYGFSMGYMRISDTQLRAEFRYGWYPGYLPSDYDPETSIYVEESIHASILFDAPKAVPEKEKP